MCFTSSHLGWLGITLLTAARLLFGSHPAHAEAIFIALGDLPTGVFSSSARGVSADGSAVAGTGSTSSGTEAFYWTQEGGLLGLGDLPSSYFSSFSFDVSADGSTVVGRGHSVSGTEAFRWTSAGGMVGLGDLPGGPFASRAWAVSGDGSVVVGRSDVSANHYEAFIWDETNGMRKLDAVLTDLGLDLTGWTLEEALGISADGNVIVGQGWNPSGDLEAWVAILDAGASVPAMGPAAMTLLGIVLGVSACWSLRDTP